MLITLLTLLIISNALSLRKDQSILFSRLVMVSLIHTSFLAYNNLFFLALDKGIGIFGGLFHVTVFTQIFNIFIFLLSALILTLTSFCTRKVFLNKKFFLALLSGFLIFFSIRLPAKLMLIALDLEILNIFVYSISAMMFVAMLILLQEKEILKAAKLLSVGVLSLTVSMIFCFVQVQMEEFLTFLLPYSLTYLNLSLKGETLTLFSESSNKNYSAPGSEQRTNLAQSEVPLKFNYKLFAQAFETKAEVILLEREKGLNTDGIRDKTVTLLDLGITESSPYYSVLKKFASEYEGNCPAANRFCNSIFINRAVKVKIYDNSASIGSKVFKAISQHS